MKGEIKRILTMTKNEQKIIAKLMGTLDEVFKLDFGKEPGDLVNIMYGISEQSPTAYSILNGDNIKIEYQND